MHLWRHLLLPLMMTSLLMCSKPQPTPEPAPSVEPNLVKLTSDQVPALRDDWDRASLLRALDRQLRWFERRDLSQSWSLGEVTVDLAHIKKTVTRFRTLAAELEGPELRQALLRDFEFYDFTAPNTPGVLITGYYAPILQGSRQDDERFRFPLYRVPSDMVFIRPSRFSTGILRPGTGLRGDRVGARMAEGQILPYYSRRDIDEDGALAGRGLEIVYLDDYFDAFLFHVQGGGFVQLRDGSYLKLNYAGKNSQPYRSIGRILVERGEIPREEVSIQAIRAYFERHPERMREVCYENPSYVFYTADDRTAPELTPDMFPSGSLGFPVTTRRSIATDKAYFPGGVLCWISGAQRMADGSDKGFSGFVIDQDTGGAIREAHLDHFLGAGDAAGELAGRLNDVNGRMIVILLKQQPQS